MNSVVTRAIIGWFAVLLMAMISGYLRERFVRPQLGFAGAEIFGATTLSLAILVMAVFVMRAAERDHWPATAVYVGLMWLIATVAFEFLFFHFVGGRSWSELAGAYRIWEGRLWLLVLLSTAVAPWLAGKWLASGAN